MRTSEGDGLQLLRGAMHSRRCALSICACGKVAQYDEGVPGPAHEKREPTLPPQANGGATQATAQAVPIWARALADQLGNIPNAAEK